MRKVPLTWTGFSALPNTCLGRTKNVVKWSDSHWEKCLVPLPFLKPIPQNVLPSWVIRDFLWKDWNWHQPLPKDTLAAGDYWEEIHTFARGAWRKGSVPPGNSQGLPSALTPNPSSLLWGCISPQTIKTQGKGHKSKVKLYFTVIFSIYKELQYMFMGTPSTGLPSFSLGVSLTADNLWGWGEKNSDGPQLTAPLS